MFSSSSFPVFGETAIQDSSQLVEKIEVYDVFASNPFLLILNARHCFMIITVNGRKKLIEAGDDNGTFRISYSDTSLQKAYKKDVRKIVQLTIEYPLEIGLLAKFFKQSFQGKRYDVIQFNCYHLLEEAQLEELIAKRYRSQVLNGTTKVAKVATMISPLLVLPVAAISIPIVFKTLLSEEKRRKIR